jgi:2-dehydro-3-deoxygalactonokinase
MIGIDWGTTSFRAFRIAGDGTIRDRRASPRGIMNVPDGRFGETLREEIGPWLAGGETQVLLSGMIGSRQGWKEAPYVPCPAGAAELAAGLTDIGFDWAKVKLVPGLSGHDESGVAEVMRGETAASPACPAPTPNGRRYATGASSASPRT